jgi:pilus assembly protein CpaB
MRRGGRVLVLLGILLGVVTAGGVYFVLLNAQPATPQIQTVSVVIAQQNIADMAEIPPESLGKADWPEPYVPPGAFKSTADVAGKVAMMPIYQGQIILPQMLLDKTKVKETRSNASFVIPEGKIAVAYNLTPLSTVAGAIQTGDMVDLIMTLSPGSKVMTGTTAIVINEGAVTQFMLQDVMILNLGNWPGPAGADKSQAPPAASMLTFALTPQDALALKAAREQGSIDLVLRRAGDHQQFRTEPVTLAYLIKRFNFIPSR